MLTAGTIAMLLGYFLSRSGLKALSDPNQLLQRAGAYRVFLGTVLANSGFGIGLIDLLSRV
jgi:hypothetical protein